MPRRMEAFLLLSIFIHVLLFSIVSAKSAREQNLTSYTQIEIPFTLQPQPEESQIASPEVTEANRKNFSQKPKKKKEIILPVESVVVIPIPVSNRTRWIVDLVDIPYQVEPDDSRYVSERPSKVDEETAATETARDPQPRKKSLKTRSAKNKNSIARKKEPKKHIVKNDEPEPNTAAPDNRENNVAQNKIRENNPDNVQQGETQTSEGNATAPPQSASGVQTDTAPGNTDVQAGTGDTVVAGGGKKKILYPSLGQLAQGATHTQSPRPASTAATETDSAESGDSEAEGGSEGDAVEVPSSPDNVLPFVKKKGSITLLNAKSYQYSGFVRRVARRMFDRFVISFEPSRYNRATLNTMKNGASYEAVMNMGGNTINVKRLRGSGSPDFDALVQSAVSKGAWDSNVPAGAECADGFVHFVFIPKVVVTNSGCLLIAVAGLKDCD